MLSKMNEYYTVKRDWVELKKAQVKENIESSQLNVRYLELKEAWELQQKRWQMKAITLI